MTYHSLQPGESDMRVSSLYFPASQSLHCVTVVAFKTSPKVPSGQLSQSASLVFRTPLWNVPLGQSSHMLSAVSPESSFHVPCGQSLQPFPPHSEASSHTRPVLSPKLPAGHNSHPQPVVSVPSDLQVSLLCTSTRIPSRSPYLPNGHAVQRL